MSGVSTNTNIPIYTGNTGTNAGGTAAPNGNTLTQNDFLNLLVAQMQYQDPTNPVSDTDFASQMAQFSSLTAINNLSTSMGQFSQFSQMSAGAGLIGATVTTSATDSSGNLINGQVTAVTANNSTVSVVVNGQAVPLSDITGIAPTQAGTSS